jgi:hypothetical protein
MQQGLIDHLNAYNSHSNYQQWSETRKKLFNALAETFDKSYVKRELKWRTQQNLSELTPNWTVRDVLLNGDEVVTLYLVKHEFTQQLTENNEEIVVIPNNAKVLFLEITSLKCMKLTGYYGSFRMVLDIGQRNMDLHYECTEGHRYRYRQLNQFKTYPQE